MACQLWSYQMFAGYTSHYWRFPAPQHHLAPKRGRSLSAQVFISHTSALQFWRKHDLGPSGGIKRVRRTTLRNASASTGAIRPLLQSAGSSSGRIYGARPDENLATILGGLGIDELPLHLMVNDRSLRRKTTSIITHYYQRALPEGSFCQIDTDVFVSSPELTLAQLSLELPLIDVLEIALEFCGGYALNPNTERGFDDRPPLTNAARLAAFGKRIKGRHGAKTLAPILPYLVDDSASPMESIVLMLLSLPSKLGGYQLPLPLHNESVPITEHAHSHTKRKNLICDLYWEDCKLDVECDSTLYHSSKEQLGIDSDRRIILDAMKYAYVGITWWQLEHEDEFENVVQAIRKAMGLRTRLSVPDHIATNRRALREYLVAPQGKRPVLRLIKTQGAHRG